MKKLLLTAFMIAGTAVFAQETDVFPGNKMLPDNAKMIEMRSQRMKADFGLNDDQTTKIQAMFTKQQQEREAVMAEVAALRANGKQLTEEQKNGFKTKMEAQRTEMDAQLKNILTPEQYTIWHSKAGVIKKS